MGKLLQDLDQGTVNDASIGDTSTRNKLTSTVAGFVDEELLDRADEDSGDDDFEPTNTEKETQTHIR